MVTSAHKPLPAMNQAALVLTHTTDGGGLLDRDRPDQAVEATATHVGVRSDPGQPGRREAAAGAGRP